MHDILHELLFLFYFCKLLRKSQIEFLMDFFSTILRIIWLTIIMIGMDDDDPVMALFADMGDDSKYDLPTE